MNNSTEVNERGVGEYDGFCQNCLTPLAYNLPSQNWWDNYSGRYHCRDCAWELNRAFIRTRTDEDIWYGRMRCEDIDREGKRPELYE